MVQQYIPQPNWGSNSVRLSFNDLKATVNRFNSNPSTKSKWSICYLNRRGRKLCISRSIKISWAEGTFPYLPKYGLGFRKHYSRINRKRICVLDCLEFMV